MERLAAFRSGARAGVVVAFVIGSALWALAGWAEALVQSGVFGDDASRSPGIGLFGFASVVGWAIFALRLRSSGASPATIVLFGVATGLLNAAVPWAIVSNYGAIPSDNDGEFCTRLIGNTSGLFQWAALGAISCWYFGARRLPSIADAVAYVFIALVAAAITNGYLGSTCM